MRFFLGEALPCVFPGAATSTWSPIHLASHRSCHGDMQMGVVNPAGYSFQMLWQMWTGLAGSVGSGRTQSRSGQAQLPIDTLSGDLTAVTSQQGL
ncbi:unnamed protein product [Boreogadus saida]